VSHWRPRVSPLSTITWDDVPDLAVQSAFHTIHQQLLLSKHHAAAEECVITLRRAADSFVTSTRVPKEWS
jgi:hypothetical protein